VPAGKGGEEGRSERPGQLRAEDSVKEGRRMGKKRKQTKILGRNRMRRLIPNGSTNTGGGGYASGRSV